VNAVCEDLESSPLDGRHKALFRFVAKVNHDSPRIDEGDIEVLHRAGWDDDAIFYAITVCALFNFYNRWVDATGVHAMSDAAHRERGKLMAKGSYVR
jgi:alkylhydroperoxidase family enzyme